MKTILFSTIFILTSISYAKDIVPKAISVRYEQGEYYEDAFISFDVTIDANDFTNPHFGQMADFVVKADDENYQIVPAHLIYGKDPAWVIVGTEVFSFQYRGQEALDLIQALNSSRVLFRNDVGSDDLAVDIAGLCRTQPESFINIAGGSGCP